MSAFLMGLLGHLKISEHISCSGLYMLNEIYLRLSGLPQRKKEKKKKKKDKCYRKCLTSARASRIIRYWELPIALCLSIAH